MAVNLDTMNTIPTSNLSSVLTDTDKYFLIRAMKMSQVSTCRRRYGAVLTRKNDEGKEYIVSTGKHGGRVKPPLYCLANPHWCGARLDLYDGTTWEKCGRKHAIQECLENFLEYQIKISDGTLYTFGYDRENQLILTPVPCPMCLNAIKTCGIKRVVNIRGEIELDFLHLSFHQDTDFFLETIPNQINNMIQVNLPDVSFSSIQSSTYNPVLFSGAIHKCYNFEITGTGETLKVNVLDVGIPNMLHIQFVRNNQYQWSVARTYKNGSSNVLDWKRKRVCSINNGNIEFIVSWFESLNSGVLDKMVKCAYNKVATYINT